MKNYMTVKDIENLSDWVKTAMELKKDPLRFRDLGQNKTLAMLFFNSSLRTRLSTHKAALNLGMDVMVMNIGKDGWILDFEEGSVMDQRSAEHIKEAAQVVAQYSDILAVRAFATLKDKKSDEAELVLNGFAKYSEVPIINMESSIHHPLQALADAITIEEFRKTNVPKVVLSWAPHPRPLPHAVANSFVELMQISEADFVLTHPPGYELNPEITRNCRVEYDQQKALENADFVYVKNWSSYQDYGEVLHQNRDWMMTEEKLGNANFMHCLPVRRNVVVEDAVLDSNKSLVYAQANNRTYAAQLVLKKLLESS
ncbi:MAG: acetylornithine carbamoyltransferase [Flavobacteriaceae bacterium]